MKIKDHEIACKFADKYNRASKNGTSFALKLAEVITLFRETDTCPYSGKELTAKSSTFERVNPFEGYLPSNTLLVTTEANEAKSGLDSFLKNPNITTDSKLRLMKLCSSYLLHNSLRRLTDRSGPLKYSVPEAGIDLSMFAPGSEFLFLRNGNDAVRGTARTVTVTGKIPHGRSFRNVTVSQDLIVLETGETMDFQISREFCQIIYVTKRVMQV